MMRLLIPAVVFALAAPAATFAQSAETPPRWTISPRTGPAAEGWPRDPAPRFSIPPRGTVGLPQIGLPLPQIGLPPHGVQVPTTDRRGGGRHRHGWSAPWPAVVYFVPQYVAPIALASEPVPIEVEVEKPAATGRLILDEQPENAQVFVDGYYAGVPEDFSVARGGGVIEAGSHRIDLSAPGYEPLALDLKIAPDQSVTYRQTLKPITKLTDVPGPPTTFYLIPGCYMGNVHPKEARLPATCDLGRVVEFRY